ncbi:NADP-dependent 3-hydroxy acid dehydrogenase YdfG [Yimella lutea]|uniref:NADP-dependent 3-hydroxy acid dehydrogenase YdfG n=1 Tax=Yimella lutea TaxID=587872 RepID=A0A542EBX1_9MICO|nr:SDR family NAD(P)-dependent oxidoreductase [Yimella lutea]TQJ12766.1 NADP-dependent 3-hydroxy acid dehydrogenase YdfG [Yimella lutea]
MKNPLRREPQSFAGKRALVTGGACGLGLAMTKILAAEGAKVLVVDVHGLAPEGVLPAGVEYRQLDVRSDEGWDETRNWVEATWGGLDLLFNNAGVAAGGRIDVESIENWQWIIDINLLGVVRGCRTFVPMMKQAGGGHIVNTASLAGLVHAPSMASYNAVKAAVVAVSETLRHELAPDRIDVSVICPSFFRTNLAESLQGKDVDMEETAVRLITQAPRSADEVASKALEGVRNRRFIVLTDSDGVAAYNAKRYARKAYDAAMIRSAKQVREGKDPMADIDKVWTRMRKSKS